jgi:hypothetical protein
MPRYEYTVVPAPKKPGKLKGIKGTDNRFAAELANLMNEYGAQGWEYQRADTLPCEERQGLTGRTTTYQNMLVFRRELDGVQQSAPSTDIAPVVETPKSAPEQVMAVPTFQTTKAPAAHTPPKLTVSTPPEGPAPRIGSAGDAPRHPSGQPSGHPSGHPSGQPPRIISGGSS